MAAAILATTLLASTAQAAVILWCWKDSQQLSLVDYLNLAPGTETQVHLVLETPNTPGLVAALNNGTFKPENFNDVIGTYDGEDIVHCPNELWNHSDSYSSDNRDDLEWDGYNWNYFSYKVFLLVVNGNDIANGDYGYYLFDTRLADTSEKAEWGGDRSYVWFGDSRVNGPEGVPENVFYQPVPEPATGLLVLGGAAVALLRRRRR